MDCSHYLLKVLKKYTNIKQTCPYKIYQDRYKISIKYWTYSFLLYQNYFFMVVKMLYSHMQIAPSNWEQIIEKNRYSTGKTSIKIINKSDYIWIR